MNTQPTIQPFDISQGLYSTNEYYVYRLVDPRTFQTFYVGKGKGTRVFDHVSEVKKLLSKDEDLISLKAQQIADILATGKQVITIIHRRGLTERQAFEVEAALIDAYPGLTNIQSGHDTDRGAITVEDLYDAINMKEYDEPDEDYIIIKTTPNAINANGSLYEATRRSWSNSLNHAKHYKYVLSVVYGVVREVYKVSDGGWYQYSNDRIAFEGEPVSSIDKMASLKGHKIPAKYRQKGAAAPFLYKK